MKVEDVKIGMKLTHTFHGREITVQSINIEKQQVTGDSGKGYDTDISIFWLKRMKNESSIK